MSKLIPLPVLDHERPQTRGDCLPGGCNEVRPCPWVSCKYHLALNVNEDLVGYVPQNRRLATLNPHPLAKRAKHPDPSKAINQTVSALSEMLETCALDVADRGGLDVREIAAIMGIGDQPASFVLARAESKLRRTVAMKRINADFGS